MWGFSTVQNQTVRSFDDPSCLICPIGHAGWAQVDIAKALLSCWGRTRHLPDPRPDLDEFQEQMIAIHAFLSKPDAIRKLATRRILQQNSSLAPPLQPGIDVPPIEFTNGHVQLEWAQGRWTVCDWKPIGTSPLGRAWIKPEENLLSALIRGPSRPEDIAPTCPVEANLEMGKEKAQYGPPPEYPHTVAGRGTPGMSPRKYRNHRGLSTQDAVAYPLPTQTTFAKQAMAYDH